MKHEENFRWESYSSMMLSFGDVDIDVDVSHHPLSPTSERTVQSSRAMRSSLTRLNSNYRVLESLFVDPEDLKFVDYVPQWHCLKALESFLQPARRYCSLQRVVTC